MRRLLPAILVLFMSFSTPIAAADTNGSFFAVIVRDIEAASTWYASTFGLAAGEWMSEPGRYKVVNLRKPGLFVELLELDGARTRPEGRVEGPFKLGMLVDDLDAFIAALPESVAAPDVINDERNNLLFVQLRDPDKNIIQVMQPLSSGAD